MIRQATLADLGDLYVLICKAHDEAGGHLLTIDHERMMDGIRDVLYDGVVFVYEKDGILIGSVGAIVEQPWFWSKDFAVMDTWYYVDSGHRNSHAAAKLIHRIKEFAAERKLPLIMGTSCGTDTERKDRYYQRKGLSRIGSTYVMEV